ncbi:hypothetical protein GCM10007161_20410 [Ignatzschineria indica]|uniref:Chemotaxis protein n=1 Tax=Ignatzschineria indica TaxID=472583 RepID=A0A2U2AI09_9GAMM|nr:hypothetical protein [Ignatzschineria indica]PWD82219.1 hypothetical protein DC082_10420 [Ignatzschineria indica]GGZ88756.1 hypothetical protein GCM10007161_20410 [Ignatzschineria indica]
MKLIIREYLNGLKERKELDALLPELLLQMGFNVLTKPMIGVRQDGVDIPAVGKLDDDSQESLWLFTVKSGNLDRKNWDGGNDQDVRPSVNEIIDVYIPAKIASEHKDLPIKIIVCVGGEIAENVHQNCTSAFSVIMNKNPNVEIEIWNGEKLALYIEKFLLNESIVHGDAENIELIRSLLRKSLALFDHPDQSHEYFKKITLLLLDELKVVKEKKSKDQRVLQNLRRLYLSLWILYIWGKGENNIESSYLSSEFVLLHVWDVIKQDYRGSKKAQKEISQIYDKLINLHCEISAEYFQKIELSSHKEFELSLSTKIDCPIALNQKLYDVIGRLAMLGLWKYRVYIQSNKDLQILEEMKNIHQTIGNVIKHNPILNSPVSDWNFIEISLVYLFCTKNELITADNFISAWLEKMLSQIIWCLDHKNLHPCIYSDYESLYFYFNKEIYKTEKEEFFKDATAASFLYPYLLLMFALLEKRESYNDIKEIQKEILSESTWQIWVPDETSENNFFTNQDIHGLAVTDLFWKNDSDLVPSRTKEAKDLLEKLFVDNISEPDIFNGLSAVEKEVEPLLLTASRYYRMPVALEFFRKMVDTNKPIQ